MWHVTENAFPTQDQTRHSTWSRTHQWCHQKLAWQGQAGSRARGYTQACPLTLPHIAASAPRSAPEAPPHTFQNAQVAWRLGALMFLFLTAVVKSSDICDWDLRISDPICCLTFWLSTWLGHGGDSVTIQGQQWDATQRLRRTNVLFQSPQCTPALNRNSGGGLGGQCPHPTWSKRRLLRIS